MAAGGLVLTSDLRIMSLLIVVVGDSKEIEPKIRELGLGEIHFVERSDVK
jgi:hypothetical protein